MILYFSGTGNSRYLAELMAEELGDELYSINEGIKNNDYISAGPAERLVFVVPVYGWRIPHVVEQWIRKNETLQGQDAYFIINCGSDIGQADGYAEQLCQEKNLRYMGTAEVVMPENYIAMFNCPDEEETRRIIKAAEPIVREAAARIRQKQPLKPLSTTLFKKIKSGPINTAFYRFCVKSSSFYAEAGCSRCGVCETVCPLNNIRIVDDGPVWGDRCTHCMACICRCPEEVIEYGRRSRGKRRYLCPPL